MEPDTSRSSDRKQQDATMVACFEMMESNMFSDISIQVQGKIFTCHKVILAAACPYFQGMFSGPFTENNAKEVSIKGVSVSTMEQLLQYIYTGKVPIDATNVERLLRGSDMLQLDGLKQLCSSYMRKQVCSSNCLGFWILARQLHLPHLEEKAWVYILQSYDSIITGKEFLSLCTDDLCALLSAPGVVSSEEIVCRQALRWLEQKSRKIPDLPQYLQKVLTSMRLDELDPVFIHMTLMTHPLVKKSQDCQAILKGVIDHMTLNTPCPSSVPLLPTRLYSGRGLVVAASKNTFSSGRRAVLFSIIPEYRKNNYVGDIMKTPLEPLPHMSWNCAICSQGNKVYIAGMGPDMKKMIKYDNSGVWGFCSPSRHPRGNFTLTSGFTDKLYAVAGTPERHLSTPVCKQNLSSVEEYSISEDRWSLVGTIPIPVVCHAAAFYMGKIFIMGGFDVDGKSLTTIQVFDTQAYSSYILELRLPRPMAYCPALVVREHIIHVSEGCTLVFKGSDLLEEARRAESREDNANDDEKHTQSDRGEDEENDTEMWFIGDGETSGLYTGNSKDNTEMSQAECPSGSKDSNVQQVTNNDDNEASATEANSDGHGHEDTSTEENTEDSCNDHDKETSSKASADSDENENESKESSSGDRDENAKLAETSKEGSSEKSVVPSLIFSDNEATLRRKIPRPNFYRHSPLYMYKRGCTVNRFTAHWSGDKLVTFGGKLGDQLTDRIQSCSLNDCLSPSTDITWNTINVLEPPAKGLISTQFKWQKPVPKNK